MEACVKMTFRVGLCILSLFFVSMISFFLFNLNSRQIGPSVVIDLVNIQPFYFEDSVYTYESVYPKNNFFGQDKKQYPHDSFKNDFFYKKMVLRAYFFRESLFSLSTINSNCCKRIYKRYLKYKKKLFQWRILCKIRQVCIA